MPSSQPEAVAELSHLPNAPSSASETSHENKDSYVQTAIVTTDAEMRDNDDDELDSLSEHEKASLEKSLLKKLDWQLLPLCGMLYLLSFLDRYVSASPLPSSFNQTSQLLELTPSILYAWMDGW